MTPPRPPQPCGLRPPPHRGSSTWRCIDYPRRHPHPLRTGVHRRVVRHDPGRQLRLALGMLATSGALRHAVHDHAPSTLETAMTLTRPAKPWGCRLNLHHHWETRTTEDGGRYLACARCDKEGPGKSVNWPMLGG